METTETHLPILMTISDIIQSLDEVEKELKQDTPQEQTIAENKIVDILHYLEFLTDDEFEQMKPTACKKVLKELRDLRLQRRKAKNYFEISKVFYTNWTKMGNKENRDFLKNSLYKTEKQLNSRYYNDRVYTEEEVRNLFPTLSSIYSKKTEADSENEISQ